MNASRVITAFKFHLEALYEGAALPAEGMLLQLDRHFLTHNLLYGAVSSLYLFDF